MTADIAFRDRTVHTTDSWIDVISIEILKHLDAGTEERLWHDGMRDSCRSNLKGRGFGMSDLDLDQHISDESSRSEILAMLLELRDKYSGRETVAASSYNPYLPKHDRLNCDIDVDKLRTEWSKIVSLFSDDTGS